MMLTDLADACRKSGLRVVEVDGWQTRGHGGMLGVSTIVCHHTATAAAALGDYPSLRIVRDGRTGLPGPLSHLGLGRDGTVYVIAAGRCYHAGMTFLTRQGNSWAIGIEAEHDGISPWPTAQRDAYVRLCAALAEHYGVPVSNVQGHKEVASPAGRKIDPTFDMDTFRADVRRRMRQVRAEIAADDALRRELGDAARKAGHRPKMQERLQSMRRRVLNSIKARQ